MRQRSKRLVLLAAIFMCLGGLGYKVTESILTRKAREIRQNPLNLLNSLPEEALHVKEFHRTKVEDGRTVWEIAGEEARYFKEQKEVVIKKPRFMYYGKNGATMEAIAEEGRLYLAGQEIDRMELSGETYLSYEGLVLQTEKIIYRKEDNQVVMPGAVRLEGRGIELEGVGLELALNNETVRLLSKVKSRIDPVELRRKG